jgi:cobalt/nickel transport system permease protein
MNATWRLGLTLLSVTCIALWPAPLWRWQAIPVVLLGVLSAIFRFRFRTLVRRAALVWLLALLMALGLLGQPDWKQRTGELLLKSTLSVWAVSLLTHTTPLPALVVALRRLGVPKLWADTVGFWGRYYEVLAEEWHRLQLARRARTMTGSRALKFRALTNGLGVLFIRAYERAEQVHRAMLARGYGEGH